MKKIAFSGLVAMSFLLSGCGVDVGFSTVFNLGMKAKQAKEAVKQEEEAKKKVLEAIKISEDKNKKAMEGSQADAEASPGQNQPSAPDVSAAMKAAEEQSK